MKKLHIAINTKTKVITQLEKKFELTYYQEQTFFEKLLLKEKKYPDIYFHQGSINTKALDIIEHSTVTIVNSNALKEQICEKRTYLKADKIFVIYPYITTQSKYDKQLKKEFRKKYQIEKEQRIIFFTGKDLELNGLEKFLETINILEKKNYKIVINANLETLNMLQERLKHYNLDKETIVLENYTNIDELFIISDIFILPTKQKLFALNVLKAMYFKNAVFVSSDNAASEIIDSFSLIVGQKDKNLSFKVDALLGNKEELKKIQKENYQVVKNMTFDNYMEELEYIISDNFLTESASTRDF
jgi:glycosyltransferase involved in cell wall biosynthesis